jgi:hypothetical protein
LVSFVFPPRDRVCPGRYTRGRSFRGIVGSFSLVSCSEPFQLNGLEESFPILSMLGAERPPSCDRTESRLPHSSRLPVWTTQRRVSGSERGRQTRGVNRSGALANGRANPSNLRITRFVSLAFPEKALLPSLHFANGDCLIHPGQTVASSCSAPWRWRLNLLRSKALDSLTGQGCQVVHALIGSACLAPVSVELLLAFDAFLQEHRRCGTIDGSSEGLNVWLSCSCSGLIMRVLDQPSEFDPQISR